MSVNNTKYGTDSLSSNTGSNNTAIGAYALINNTDASKNTGVGSNVMYFNTTGTDNTAVGSGSLCNNTTGRLNTAVGSSALEGLNVTGSNVGDQNVAIGVQSLYNSDGGNQNTATGSYSLYKMLKGAANTAVGFFAGLNDVSGNYNTYLGAYTGIDLSANTYEYSTAIGYNAKITASHQIVLGASSEIVIIDGSLNVLGNSYFDASMDASAIYLPDVKPYSSYAENEVVPKSYVDTASQGLTIKAPCQCIATSGVTITSAIDFSVSYTYNLPIVIDGYDLSGNASPPNRVLFNNQGTPDTSANILNGIYDVSLNVFPSITFVRSQDMPNGSDALGAYTFIENGTVNAKSSWVQSQKVDNLGTPVVVGTNALLFVKYGSIDYKIGRGLELEYIQPYTYLNVDTCLNFINYLDNNVGIDASNMYIGYNTTNTYIGDTNNVNVTGFTNFTHDISVNSLTVGRGGGNSLTNTSIGYQALATNTGGLYNTALGYQALATNTGGDYNTALGYGALTKSLNGSNTAIGLNALSKISTGSSNTGVGVNSLLENSSGIYNVAIGYQSGTNDISGNSNTYLGTGAGIDSSANIYNNSTALGQSATIDASNQIVLGTSTEGVYIPGNYLGIGVYTPTSGNALDVSGNANFTHDISVNSLTVGRGSGNISTNTALGIDSLLNNISGFSNTAIGNNSLLNNTDGYLNTAIGDQSLKSNTIGESNIAIGFESLQSNIDGSNNIAIGTNSLYINSSGSYNTAIGIASLLNNTLGNDNTAVGYNSLYNNSTGFYNTAIGFESLYNTDSSYNTAIGYQSLYTNSSGIDNTAIGYQSLQKNTLGIQNTAIGLQSLQNNTIGGANTSIGLVSLQKNTTGANNTAIGVLALGNNTIGSLNVAIGRDSLNGHITGDTNVAIGYQSGTNDISGNNNTYLGTGTGIDSNTNIYNNSTALGQSARIDASNQIVLGGLNNDAIPKYPDVYIPGNLYVDGSINVTGVNLTNAILNVVYPIGSIYMNYDSSDNPTTILGFGTWDAISGGTMLTALYNGTGDASFNTLDASGGYATIQAHNHQWAMQQDASGSHTIQTNANTPGQNTWNNIGNPIDILGAQKSNYYTSNTVNNADAHSNYAPYVVVAMWKRTA